MAKSRERICRWITRGFLSFQINSNHILNDANVLITYEEVSERALSLYKTYVSRRVLIRRRTLANIVSCDRGIATKTPDKVLNLHSS